MYSKLIRHVWAAQDTKAQQAYDSYERLIAAISKMELPENIQNIVNIEIGEVNAFEQEAGSLFVFIKKSQVALLSVLESQLGIVAKNHYRNQWMALGSIVYGLPFGVMIAVLSKNYAFLGLGLAIGIPIGMAIGKSKDDKAAASGKQLDFER